MNLTRNILKFWPVWSALLLISLAVSGCGTFESAHPSSGETNDPAALTGSQTLSPVVASPASTNRMGPDLLQPGIKLTIEFLDLPNPIQPLVQTIHEDGTITLPFSQEVMAAGKNKGQLEDEIRALYVPKYYRRLTVNIKTEDRFFYVGGEVKAPGRQLYIGEMTVLKAIQSASDFTDFAKKKKVQLTRSNARKKETINCEKARQDPKLDLPIYPGDNIYVPRRFW